MYCSSEGVVHYVKTNDVYNLDAASKPLSNIQTMDD